MKFLVFLIGVVYPFFHPAPLYYFVRDFEILDQPDRNLNDLLNLDFVEDKSGPAWHIYGKRLLENRRSNRVFKINLLRLQLSPLFCKPLFLRGPLFCAIFSFLNNKKEAPTKYWGLRFRSFIFDVY